MAFSTTQISGSPFTAPHSGIDTLCYVNNGGNKRLYYTQGSDFTKIYCMTLTGTADSTREITVSSMNSANTTTMEGLCSDGSFIYALVGAEGSQAIHKYRLMDRSLVAHLDVNVRQTLVGIETYVVGHTRYILVLGQQQVNGWDDSLDRQTVADFVLSGATGVGSGDWLGLAYDTETSTILALGEVTPEGGGTPTEGIFGFSIAGARKDSEDVNFGTISFKGMTFNGDDDRLYMMHGSSNQLYGYGETVRWNISSANLNVTQGTNYTLDLNIYASDNAVISVAPGTDLGDHAGALLSNGIFTWTNPPAPAGGASLQVVPLTFRATLGANHVDQTFNFQLHGTVVTVAPAWVGTGIPQQNVFEPYTPPANAPTPQIAHGFTINLSDYLRVGTPPVTFTASDDSGNTPGRFSINTRFVNGQSIRDVLTYNAGSVSDLVQAEIGVRASNSRGHDTTDVSVHVHNLAYPSWSGTQDINISDTASHSVNLRDYLNADPQADIELATGSTLPTGLNAHLNNAILTLRADNLPTNVENITHQVTFKATNILTDTTGVTRRFNIIVSRQQVPASAPVWQTDIVVQSSRGATGSVNLNQYILSASPAPTFTIKSSDANLNASIDLDDNLNFTIPGDIVTNTDYTAVITATNATGSADVTITIRAESQTVPRLDNVPRQTVNDGGNWTFDLNNYVNGQTPITYAFSSSFTPPGDMTLDESVITYNPSSIMESSTLPISITATNLLGTSTFIINLFVTANAIPIWTSAALSFSIIEGQDDIFNLTRYVTSDQPFQIHFANGYNPLGLNITLNNGQLEILDAPVIDRDTDYTIEVVAVNATGMAEKNINLRVLSRLELEDPTNLTIDDYNEIRFLLGSEITEEELPDTVIARSVYEGAAKDWVSFSLPYNPDVDRTLINLRRKKRSILYRCASLIAGHSPSILSESIGAGSKSFGEVDWLERQADLQLKAQHEIDLVRLEEEGTTKYTLFTVTGGI